MQNEEDLQCVICYELAINTYDCSVCKKLLCKGCAEGVNQLCPMCRATNTIKANGEKAKEIKRFSKRLDAEKVKLAEK